MLTPFGHLASENAYLVDRWTIANAEAEPERHRSKLPPSDDERVLPIEPASNRGDQDGRLVVKSNSTTHHAAGHRWSRHLIAPDSRYSKSLSDGRRLDVVQAGRQRQSSSAALWQMPRIPWQTRPVPIPIRELSIFERAPVTGSRWFAPQGAELRHY